MALTREQKQEVFSQYQRNEKDTGSAEVQIAMLTKRINDLTAHMKQNPKDFATKRGLMVLVGKRRRLQNYYKKQVSLEDYKALIDRLGLRK